MSYLDSSTSAQQQQQQQQQVEAPPEASTSGQQHPECYVIVYNISKKHNVGTLLRSCTAFGVKEVCLVGPSRQYNAFGSHGADAHVRMRHFKDVETCCSYLKDSAGCRILGVEIDASAQPVQRHPFSGNTAFMLGNEGTGLSERQMRLCDGYVYIPQHGQGTASLNVTVAASIILHQFAIWAAYPERQRDGAKFVVDPRPQRTSVRGEVPLSPEELAEMRRQRRGRGGAAGDGVESLAGCGVQEDGEEWLRQAGVLNDLM
ncbi:hypothetical protein OEZ86_014383 [Tetradesmus obliquus]|nr:hypothetical protein OEZ86_014383 [Tetradesmus obliquus]